MLCIHQPHAHNPQPHPGFLRPPHHALCMHACPPPPPLPPLHRPSTVNHCMHTLLLAEGNCCLQRTACAVHAPPRIVVHPHLPCLTPLLPPPTGCIHYVCCCVCCCSCCWCRPSKLPLLLLLLPLLLLPLLNCDCARTHPAPLPPCPVAGVESQGEGCVHLE